MASLSGLICTYSHVVSLSDSPALPSPFSLPFLPPGASVMAPLFVGFWFCFVVFLLGVISKLGLQSCSRYVSMSYFPTIFTGYVMVVHGFYAE